MDVVLQDKPLIIAFCGFEGSGKNAAAELLTRHSFVSRSFAHNLKHAICDIFGWDFDMIEGVTEQSRIWREQVDEWWAKELDMPGLTPRQVMQKVGTDVMRNHFSDKLWVLSLKNKLMKDITIGSSIVVTDCRFPSEATAIKGWGGHVIKIERSASTPQWMGQFALVTQRINSRDYKTNEDYCTACATLVQQECGVHPAETSLLLYNKFDYIIHNNGTLQELQHNITKMLIRLAPKHHIKNIAIDFDDVLVPFMQHFIQYGNRTGHVVMDYDKCKTLNLNDLLQCEPERKHEIFSEFIASHEFTALHQLAPSKECKEVLHQLKQSYGLIVVTAREHRLEHITKDYLDQHFGGLFNGVYLANYHGQDGTRHTKEQLCIQYNCQVLVDDSMTNIAALDSSPILGILFGNYPWHITATNGDLRARTWLDLLKLLL